MDYHDPTAGWAGAPPAQSALTLRLVLAAWPRSTTRVIVMVGSLMCAVCDELLVLDDPGQLRPAARRFCSRHRHPHGSRLLAQFGGQPVEVTSIEQLLGDVAESRHLS